MSAKDNLLCSEISCLVDDAQICVDREAALAGIMAVLIAAGVSSDRLVPLFEKNFGEEGKYVALCIKINEGW